MSRAEEQVWDGSLAAELKLSEGRSEKFDRGAAESRPQKGDAAALTAVASGAGAGAGVLYSKENASESPAPRHSQNIAGCNVWFPPGNSPFPPQLAVMSKAITALRRSQSALLESPTGTGKTLALLCSALAWQRPYRQAAFEAEVSAQKHAKELLRGKRLKLEYEAENANDDSSSSSSSSSSSTKNRGNQEKQVPQKKLTAPRVPQIFFCSRTHSQLSQAVAELKRCPKEYLDAFGGLKMTILASRKHACTHPMVEHTRNVDDDCRRLRAENRLKKRYALKAARSENPIARGGGGGGGGEDDEDFEQQTPGPSSSSSSSSSSLPSSAGCGCPHESRAFVVRGSLPTVWDLEDLTHTGRRVGGCGYYASHEATVKAHVVLCPYNYLVDPTIRKALDIQLHSNESVVIFDEAHNIEGVARDAASADLSVDSLAMAARELRHLAQACRGDDGTNSATTRIDIDGTVCAAGGAHHGAGLGGGSTGKESEGTGRVDVERESEMMHQSGKEVDEVGEMRKGAQAATALAATVEALVVWAQGLGTDRRCGGSGGVFASSRGKENGRAHGALRREHAGEDHCVVCGEEALAGFQHCFDRFPGAISLVETCLSPLSSMELDQESHHFDFKERGIVACSSRSDRLSEEGSISQYEEFNPQFQERSSSSSSSNNDEDNSSGSVRDRLNALLQAALKASDELVESKFSMPKRKTAAGRRRHRQGRVNSESSPDTASTMELSSPTRAILSSLVTVLGFMVGDGLVQLPAYRVVVKRERRPPAASANVADAGSELTASSAGVFSLTLCFWCLSAHVAFQPLRKACRSLLLTSGTLSPLTSFVHELGLVDDRCQGSAPLSGSCLEGCFPSTSSASTPIVRPPIKLEAGHVVNLQRQVWAGSISALGFLTNDTNGFHFGGGGGGDGERPAGVTAGVAAAVGGVNPTTMASLKCTWENQNSASYQDALGRCLVAVASVAPAGMLVFFPSYGLLAKIYERWRVSGILRQLKRWKAVFREPRASEGGADALDGVLQEYLREVRRSDSWATPRQPPPSASAQCSNSAGSVVGAPGDGNSFPPPSLAPTPPSPALSPPPPVAAATTVPVPVPVRNGAVLLAVCRGKVSEGLDFRDDAARTVVVVGIPYPHWKDLKVTLKREYQTAITMQQQARRRQLIYLAQQEQHHLQQQQRLHDGYGTENHLMSSQSSASCSSLLSRCSTISSIHSDDTSSNVNQHDHVTAAGPVQYLAKDSCSSLDGDVVALDGDEWYRQQAFRALNQAVGRCVRHRGDFGAVLLVDPRFARGEVVESLSRWLRPCVRHHGTLAAALPSLRAFFVANEERRIRLPAETPDEAEANTPKIIHQRRRGRSIRTDGRSASSFSPRRTKKNGPSPKPSSKQLEKENKKATGKHTAAVLNNGITMTRFFKFTPEAEAAAAARVEREAREGVDAAAAMEASRDAKRAASRSNRSTSTTSAGNGNLETSSKIHDKKRAKITAIGNKRTMAPLAHHGTENCTPKQRIVAGESFQLAAHLQEAASASSNAKNAVDQIRQALSPIMSANLSREHDLAQSTPLKTKKKPPPIQLCSKFSKRTKVRSGGSLKLRTAASGSNNSSNSTSLESSDDDDFI